MVVGVLQIMSAIIINGTDGVDFIAPPNEPIPEELVNKEFKEISLTAEQDDGYLIDAGAGDDFIIAWDGDDTIIGGAGNDTITGGAGADVFGFNAEDFGNGSEDIIKDFKPGEDKIVFKGLPDDVSVAYDNIIDSIIVTSGEGIVEHVIKIQDDDSELDDINVNWEIM